MAALVTALAIAGACDNTGAPVAGGTAYFTVPNTANQAVVPYADQDATAAAPLVNGGVPLDAGGRAQVYLARPADIRVEDSSGQTVATYKEVGGTAAGIEVLNAGFTGALPSGALGAGGRTRLDTVLSSIAASLGGTDGTFLAASTGVPRSIKSKFLEASVSVKDFGAIGNGLADDTTAIQNAIAAAVAAGGGTVYFPPGTYLISSALAWSSTSITIQGVSSGVSIIKNTNASASAFSSSSNGVTRFSGIAIAHSSTSTAAAIATTITNDTQADGVNISNHAGGISTSGQAKVTNSLITTSAGGALGALAVAGGIVVGGSLSSTAGPGVSATSGILRVFGTTIGGTYGIDVGAFASLYAYGVDASAASVAGLRTATTSVVIFHQGCNWGAVTDQRTGAPVNYTVTTTSAVTPLPSQADTIRVNGNAGGITITVNAPANMGFGRRWTLMCTNTSAGAITWSFAAAYHLSASVAPLAGNRVNLLLEQDPVTGNIYEVGRAATSN